MQEPLVETPRTPQNMHEIREYLHMHPEISFKEYKTSSFIKRYLKYGSS